MYGRSASVYDLLYTALGKDYEAESEEVRALLLSHAPDARSLLDIACGTGQHLARLAKWYDVTGLDLSPDMLAEARTLNPAAPLVLADLVGFDLGVKFDAAICLFSSIAYAGSAERLAAAIASIAGHLNNGGIAVVDGWYRPDDWHPGRITVHTAQDEDTAVVRMSRAGRVGDISTMDWEFLVGTREGIDRYSERHELGLYTPDDWKSAFSSAGLTLLSEERTTWRDRPRLVLRRCSS